MGKNIEKEVNLFFFVNTNPVCKNLYEMKTKELLE